MKTKQLVMYGVGATFISTFLTGKEGLQQIQANRDSERIYAQSLTSNKISSSNAKKESEIVWEMVQQEGVIPVVGLTPKINEWSFVSVPLAVGQVVTIGGKKEQSFAPGTLLGDRTGRIGRVGLNGKVESPINGSQNPNYLPIIPVEKIEFYSQTLTALKDRPNMPQAVVSSLQELAQRRIAIEAQTPVSSSTQSTPISPSSEPEVIPPSKPNPQPKMPKPESVAQTQPYPTFKQTEVVENLPKVNLN